MLKSVLRAAFVIAVGFSATKANAQSLMGGSQGMPSMAVPEGSVAGLSGTSGTNALSSDAGITQQAYTVDGGNSSAASRIYGSIDFLAWQISNRSVPITLGTSGYPPSLGVLGQPGVTMLGGNSLKYDNASPGLKIAIGWWYDDAHSIGSDFSFNWMFSQKSTFAVTSDGSGNPVIARPFFDTLFYQEDVRVLALPGFNSGGYLTQSTFRMWGADVDPLVFMIAGDSTSAFSGILGFKYQYINESYSILDSSQAIGSGTVNYQGNTFGTGYSTSVLDRSVAGNNFYGGTLGIKWHGELSNFTFDVTGKVSIGGNEEVVDFYGASFLYSPQGQMYGATQGGLMAQNTNSGKFDTYKLAVLPELNATLGYKIFQGVEIHLSYNLMYLNSVVRAAEQFDNRQVNSGIVPTSPNYGINNGSTAPIQSLVRTDFTAQAIGFGVTFSY